MSCRSAICRMLLLLLLLHRCMIAWRIPIHLKLIRVYKLYIFHIEYAHPYNMYWYTDILNGRNESVRSTHPTVLTFTIHQLTFDFVNVFCVNCRWKGSIYELNGICSVHTTETLETKIGKKIICVWWKNIVKKLMSRSIDHQNWMEQE